MQLRWIKTVAALGIMLALGAVSFPGKPLAGPENQGSTFPEDRILEGENTVAHLYFINPKGYFLSAEERVVENRLTPALFAKTLIEELLDGPRGSGIRCIPKDSRLLAVYVRDGLCYVDFSQEIFRGLPGSAEAEYMTVFALVNTLCLNVQDISSVKILINGNEAETLGGHVDLTYPFGADMTIIR
ncbi:MAG: GerMN domain-containing protein [Desulfatibacillum sp.]|nr:GerMN domain-containing protein [Desulfatibacillum sp.]